MYLKGQSDKHCYSGFIKQEDYSKSLFVHIIYLDKYLKKSNDIDNIDVDYGSSHNINMVPMDLNNDKNEIIAMNSFK